MTPVGSREAKGPKFGVLGQNRGWFLSRQGVQLPVHTKQQLWGINAWHGA
jgi:hypothetical protein